MNGLNHDGVRVGADGVGCVIRKGREEQLARGGHQQGHCRTVQRHLLARQRDGNGPRCVAVGRVGANHHAGEHLRSVRQLPLHAQQPIHRDFRCAAHQRHLPAAVQNRVAAHNQVIRRARLNQRTRARRAVENDRHAAFHNFQHRTLGNVAGQRVHRAGFERVALAGGDAARVAAGSLGGLAEGHRAFRDGRRPLHSLARTLQPQIQLAVGIGRDSPCVPFALHEDALHAGRGERIARASVHFRQIGKEVRAFDGNVALAVDRSDRNCAALGENHRRAGCNFQFLDRCQRIVRRADVNDGVRFHRQRVDGRAAQFQNCRAVLHHAHRRALAVANQRVLTAAVERHIGAVEVNNAQIVGERRHAVSVLFVQQVPPVTAQRVIQPVFVLRNVRAPFHVARRNFGCRSRLIRRIFGVRRRGRLVRRIFGSGGFCRHIRRLFRWLLLRGCRGWRFRRSGSHQGFRRCGRIRRLFRHGNACQQHTADEKHCANALGGFQGCCTSLKACR